MGNKELLSDLTLRCSRAKSREGKELATILVNPHVRALLDIHDDIAETIREPGENHVEKFLPEVNGMTGDTIRMVGLRKKPGEPLGLTVGSSLSKPEQMLDFHD